jgi:ABC-type transport system involved in cytochrome bd biosynthesis fused ATPase/permease subunit
METEVQQEYLNTTISQDTTSFENSQSQNQPMLPPAKSSGEEWRLFVARISDFLEKLPEYLSRFLSEYKQPIINVAAIFAAIIGVKVLLALLDALNDIPLISPIFEMIGIGYTVWFIPRYLLRKSTRQELSAEINFLKQQIVGDRLSERSI